jgi:indolepyruvate ferredoxin oxidoreductase alpha subunit
MKNTILMGNEAVARGIYEADVRVATGYPGTPSTEILEAVARETPEISAQWSPNEKVALEVAYGACVAGVRAVAVMKLVGLNVAADPLFTFAYSGVNAGLVIINADDPGQWSSQNEQDNRNYARHAKLPMLEPSDPDEARRFIKTAFELSEEFDTPVIVRITTRIAHSRALVGETPRISVARRPFQRDPKKYVMIPAHGRLRHLKVEETLGRLRTRSETSDLNRLELRSSQRGIICDSVAYQYVRDTCPEASILKIGMVWPLPDALIRALADHTEELVVVEELDPFIEQYVKAMGITVSHGKDVLPLCGELNADIVDMALNGHTPEDAYPAPPFPLPPRPPQLCKGCPYALVFKALRELDLNVFGDIGCYTLGALEPHSAMHTQTCMGASIGMHLGAEKADPEMGRNSVAVIGDSTFIHSGITGLIDLVYNQGTGTVIILDNRTTAMTGHQQHPGTGETLRGDTTTALNIDAVVRALGVKRVRTIDPIVEEGLKELIAVETATPEPSVIIVSRPCILLHKA